ncbi:Hypothetical protein PMT_2286 [Prochlorococcus marinus str. MIT 9313]|uniref:Uncharacterized protein n=1 Tax=Prochlorococcus marinus (strain MIT 9313) TaxID=74547 RepID=B9ERC5_PROMM|nr:Hypothetical protein PMT_2286 [Prochlorococcus marinus str. MIT 9313]
MALEWLSWTVVSCWAHLENLHTARLPAALRSNILNGCSDSGNISLVQSNLCLGRCVGGLSRLVLETAGF